MDSSSGRLYHAKRLLRLPRDVAGFKDRLESLHKEFLALNHQVKSHTESIGQLGQERLDSYEDCLHRVRLLDDRLTDALHQLSLLQEEIGKPGHTSTEATTTSSLASGLFADEHVLDNLYVEFERWCRGNETEIKKRQQVYVPYLTQSKLDSAKTPVLDIGCGRGEFVQLLQEHDIRAIGLDLNKAMVQRLKDKGLEAIQADALTYLRKQKTGSLMAVTGFHIVEHIPFIDLVRLLNECYRVLAPGGLAIFETPNPENTLVGSCTFYMDPSHLHPLPPALMELTLKTRGFPQAEIKRLHPIKAKISHSDPLVKEMAEHFFGPQDYAVIATK